MSGSGWTLAALLLLAFVLAVLLACFTERSWRWRLGIVAAVIPLALPANLVRVVATVLAARAYGIERAAQHTLHEIGGLLSSCWDASACCRWPRRCDTCEPLVGTHGEADRWETRGRASGRMALRFDSLACAGVRLERGPAIASG